MAAMAPLHVPDQQSPRPITRAFVDAAVECQHRVVTDFNTDDNEGVGLYQVTQLHDTARNGERCSVAAAYLGTPGRTCTSSRVPTRPAF